MKRVRKKRASLEKEQGERRAQIIYRKERCGIFFYSFFVFALAWPCLTTDQKDDGYGMVYRGVFVAPGGEGCFSNAP